MAPVRIDHIAIWTHRLEILKEFYIDYFQGEAGAMYHNKKKNFKNYFIAFGTETTQNPRLTTGAVTLNLRFGGAINLNVHFHMLFLDGVYVDKGNGSAMRF